MIKDPPLLITFIAIWLAGTALLGAYFGLLYAIAATVAGWLL